MSNSQQAEIQAAVTAFIRDTLMRGKGVDALTPTVNLFTSGLVDSLGAMKLVSWLETTYRVRIPPTDLVPDHFQTVEIIGAYMDRLLENSSSGG